VVIQLAIFSMLFATVFLRLLL